MNIDKFAEWAKEGSNRAYGEHAAYAQCHAEFKKIWEDDAVETKIMLDSVLKPTDTERSIWDITTKNYVEMLEYIVNGIVANQPAAKNSDGD